MAVEREGELASLGHEREGGREGGFHMPYLFSGMPIFVRSL